MFHTLRNRLIFSHILPSLVVIPLMGVVMLYMLENQILLPMVYKNLAADARLMAQIAGSYPELWTNQGIARTLVNSTSEFLSGEVELLLLDGSVLVVGEPGGPALPGQRVELPNLQNLEAGEVLELQRGPYAQVYTPVQSDSGQALGIVRMTSRVVTVTDEIYQLRYLLAGMLLLGVTAGIVLGSYLAVSINRPIQQMTNSISTLASGNWDERLEESGTVEIRVLARTYNDLVDRLQSLEQARRQLLANLVHELGRPLGAFRSAIQALLKGASRDPTLSRELLQGMDGESARLQRLLDDLAQLHDQVLGVLELHRLDLDLATWLPGILAPWEAAALQKELRWEAHIEPHLPRVSVDPDRLDQAISNLVNNAIKFTPPKGLVSISVFSNQERVWFQVQDSGPGIPPEEQELIFNPFFRGYQAKRIIQGMGLGLSIAKDIIQAHEGEISVQSTPGSGSSFTFWLNPAT